MNTIPHHVRWMIKRDMPEVLTLALRDEQLRAMGPGAEEYLISLLRRRECIGMVAEYGDILNGWVIYELRKRRVKVLHLCANNTRAYCDLVHKLRSKLSAHRRRFCHFSVRLDQENVEFLKWCAREGAQIVSDGKASDSVTVTFSVPAEKMAEVEG